MGSEQIGRDLVITVGTVRIATNPPDATRRDQFGNVIATPSTMSPLTVEFRVEKTPAKEPNTAEFSIYNLTEGTRAAFRKKKAEVVIEAGYSSNRAVIFKGQVESTKTTKQGVDRITTVSMADGGFVYRSARVKETFKPGTKIGQVLKSVVEGMGVDIGNAVEVFEKEGFRKGISEFANGVSLSGKATDELEKLAHSAGLEWTIQDGKFQFSGKSKNETVGTDEVKIDRATGMIGSPDIGEDGVLSVKTLLNGNIWPGRKISVTSDIVSGFFKAKHVVHDGATVGLNWYTTVEAVAI